MKCCVIGCRSYTDTVNGNEISFHSFPSDVSLKNKWILLLNRENWTPTKYTKICSLHFDKEDIVKTRKGYRKLREGASPKSLQQEQGFNQTHEPCNNPVDLKEFLVFNDTPKEKKLKEEIARLKMLDKKRLLKLRRLRQNLRRLRKKVRTMESLITELKQKNLLNDEDADILSSMDVKVRDIVERYIAKSLNKPVKKEYSPTTRAFALTLFYYSPKAYRYVRETFNTCLPHPRTIAKWCENVDGEPGFTKESFSVLKLKSERSNEKILCSLMMDEMAVRKHVEWDGEKYHGYVDLGTNASQNDNSQQASQVLVMLLVGLKERWKIPVGYFFIHSMTGEQRASLVEQCLYKCHESGVEVASLTMDGCAANIAMAKRLGCSFEPTNFITTFKHPSANYEVAVLLDACHMLKLIRNTFEAKKILIDYQGNEIKWSYLKKLNEFQKSEGLHVANKIKDAHLDFSRQKMKVKLASQLFSNSVADALLTCEKHDKRFAGVQATAEFIRFINNLFDILNSRSMKQHGFKKPLFERNIEKTKEFFNYARNYLLHLSVKNENTTLIKTNRKTGFIGFITCIDSTMHLYSRLVDGEKKLKYLTMHKLSQDHLELFFGIIRAHGRTNNNPTARQFKAAYKKNLVQTELKDSFSGNCIPLEDLHVLNMSSIGKINATAARCRMLVQNENETETDEPIPENILIEFDEMMNNTSQNYLRRQIISYISGYVVKSIAKKIKCETCLNTLFTGDYNEDHRLIKIKDKGGLIFPAADVINICIRTECSIRTFNCSETVVKKHQIISHTMKTLIGENYFQMLNDHSKEQPPLYNHITHLCKGICEKYINIRFRHIATTKNERVTKRQHFNKTVLFTGD